MDRMGQLRISRVLVPCLVLAAVGFCGLAAQTLLGSRDEQAWRSVELFSWGAWNRQQQALIRRTNALTSSLSHLKGSGVSGLEDQGRAIKDGLRSLTRMVRPQRAAAAARRAAAGQKHYRTMDQELAILKVQKQMRSEAHFPKDHIHGAGDVVGQLGEQDERDLNNALFLPNPSGPNTHTADLFENCEDGSLTVEDAELCGRRASAIKQLTQDAINRQIAESPPQDPSEAPAASKENSARSQLIADAMIGKEYLERLRQEKKRIASLTGELHRKVRKAGVHISGLRAAGGHARRCRGRGGEVRLGRAAGAVEVEGERGEVLEAAPALPRAERVSQAAAGVEISLGQLGAALPERCERRGRAVRRRLLLPAQHPRAFPRGRRLQLRGAPQHPALVGLPRQAEAHPGFRCAPSAHACQARAAPSRRHGARAASRARGQRARAGAGRAAPSQAFLAASRSAMSPSCACPERKKPSCGPSHHSAAFPELLRCAGAGVDACQRGARPTRRECAAGRASRSGGRRRGGGRSGSPAACCCRMTRGGWGGRPKRCPRSGP